jgi:hypothetical protein
MQILSKIYIVHIMLYIIVILKNLQYINYKEIKDI